MKILLTGSTGMVGRNVLEHPGIKEFHLIQPTRSELNLLDAKQVEEFLLTSRPDIVVHAAGRVGGIQANIANPIEFFVENMDMGRNLVWGAFKAGIKKFLNLGSSCMYPRDAENPLAEESIMAGKLEPTNEGYALAKIGTAYLCRAVNQVNPEFQYKTLVPCNLYGRWDKFDLRTAHMIPAVIRKIHDAIKQGTHEVEIWGEGKVRREFMYAGDMADCILESIHRFDDLPFTMNVGLGHDYSISQYYQSVADVLGFQGTFSHDVTKPEGMKQKLVDVRKQALFGWTPKTSLEDGILQTYKFFLEMEGAVL